MFIGLVNATMRVDAKTTPYAMQGENSTKEIGRR